MKIELKDLMQNYKDRMLNLGINQNEFAKEIGVSTTTLSNIFLGKNGSFPKIRNIEETLNLLESNKKSANLLTYKQRLAKLNITQEYISKKLGVTKQEISRKINNKRTESSNWPELEEILKEFENEKTR